MPLVVSAKDMPYTIKTERDTWLKRSPVQSNKLSAKEKIFFPSGEDLVALAIAPEKKDDHIRVTFDFQSLPTDTDEVAKALLKSKLNTWFVWPEHYVKVAGTEIGNNPVDVPSTRQNLSSAIPAGYDYVVNLPGRSKVNMGHPIVEGARMRWYEALHFDPSTKRYRPPEDSVVTGNIIRLAEFDRDKVRPWLAKQYGCGLSDVSIGVNSWYRDPVTNRAVGGASQSRHLWGDAIDCRVFIRGRQVNPYEANKRLDPLFSQGGLASASVFTHFDLRGYCARWSYGF